MRLRSPALVVLFALVATVGLAGAPRAADDPCVRIPTSGEPLWVDYGEGAVPTEVRDVLARPGVTVAASGTFLPTQYRAKGARTTYWVLKLPSFVGSPAAPADPASIGVAGERIYRLAVKSTLCETPIVALNELAGPAAPVPWSDTVRAYRANVLALMQRLSELGATPVLLIHGNPVYAGEAAPWWRAVGATGHVVYEAYYKAPNIARLGRIVGPRRVRLGMRSVIRSLVAVGVPRNHLGLMLGFQTAPGKAGREGLQPASAWFRYVKWNALAARQVALDERVSSIWSWGWGNLGPGSADSDKPAAACVYVWARDSALCDGVAAAGPGFDRSRVEGAIVLPAGIRCISVTGKLADTTVTTHAALLRDTDLALDATFTRQVLRKALPISRADLDAYEQALVDRAFSGSLDAYLAELTQRGLTRAVARGILEDALRRERVASAAGAASPVSWIADRVSAALDTATCRGDRLPGQGDFPTTDRRESAGAALGQIAPVLLGDTSPPEPVSGVAATSTGPTSVALTWADNLEPDLVGYLVSATDPDGRTRAVVKRPWPRPTAIDRSAKPGTTYSVVAVDLGGNASEPVAVTPQADRRARRYGRRRCSAKQPHRRRRVTLPRSAASAALP